MKNQDSQSILLSIVNQLVNGHIQIHNSKQNNTFTNQNHNLRVNNFISNQSIKNIQQNYVSNNNYNKKNTNQQSLNSFVSKSQNQKSNLNDSKQINNNKSSLTSSNLDASLKNQQQNTLKDIKKQQPIKKQQSIEQLSKQDKKKKNIKQKKQIIKPPEEATDLMGDLMGKFKTKDVKIQNQKKNQLFQSKRAFSQQKNKKVVDPSQSGTNQIRGVSMGKMNSFMTKFYNPTSTTTNPVKNQSLIQQELDQFQQSKDSTRKNPLFSSSESGFDKSGYYDKSVDSNVIQDFEYIQKAKKFNKKF